MSDIINYIIRFLLGENLPAKTVAQVGYTADPEKFPSAEKFDKITYDEIYTRGLRIMDLTATTLCKENNLPIIVFNMDKKGNLLKVVHGEPVGTFVYND